MESPRDSTAERDCDLPVVCRPCLMSLPLPTVKTRPSLPCWSSCSPARSISSFIEQNCTRGLLHAWLILDPSVHNPALTGMCSPAGRVGVSRQPTVWSWWPVQRVRSPAKELSSRRLSPRRTLFPAADHWPRPMPRRPTRSAGSAGCIGNKSNKGRCRMRLR